MKVNLIQLVKQEYNQDVLSALAGHLGESQDHLETAINGSIPALFAALLKKGFSSGQTGLSNMVTTSEAILGGHDRIGEKLKSIFASLKDPNGIQLMEKTVGILENIYGDRLYSVATAISDFSAIKSSSAHQLLAGTAVASMAVIAQVKDSQRLDDQEVVDLLVAQKKEIIEQVPSGLDLAAALGVDQLSGIDIQPNVPNHDLAAADKIAPGKSGKWLVLLIILALLVALWWFWKRYNERQENYKLQTTSGTIGGVKTIMYAEHSNLAWQNDNTMGNNGVA